MHDDQAESGTRRDETRKALRRASCNEASSRARVSVMTDYRGINSLFNQQTAYPACRLSNKVWRPWPRGSRVRRTPTAANRSPFCHSFVPIYRRGTRRRARALLDALRIPRPPPSSIGPPSICNFPLRGILRVFNARSEVSAAQ